MPKPTRPEIREDHIGAFRTDPRNARKHNPRNVGMIERSLNEAGAGRSIVTTKDGTIIAGNATVDAAALAGIEDAIVVHTSGDKLIVHVRDDLEEGDPRAIALGLYDNRAAELAEWDVEVLQGMAEEFGKMPSFDHIFSDADMKKMLGTSDKETSGNGNPALGEIEYRIVVDCTDEHNQLELMEKFQEMGLSFKPLMS